MLQSPVLTHRHGPRSKKTVLGQEGQPCRGHMGQHHTGGALTNSPYHQHREPGWEDHQAGTILGVVRRPSGWRPLQKALNDRMKHSILLLLTIVSDFNCYNRTFFKRMLTHKPGI